jgi:hypothetical protein
MSKVGGNTMPIEGNQGKKAEMLLNSCEYLYLSMQTVNIRDDWIANNLSGGTKKTVPETGSGFLN